MSRLQVVVVLGLVAISVFVFALYLKPTDQVPTGWWRLNWRLDPAYPLTADSRVVHVIANEGNCVNETEKRLMPPVIEYRPAEIEIALYVREHSNLTTSCNDVPVQVELSEPVGARQLTGGSHFERQLQETPALSDGG